MESFTDFGPFVEDISNDERNRRLERLAQATMGTDGAAFIEMIRLTREHPRNLLPLLDTLNKLSGPVKVAIAAAYERAA